MPWWALYGALTGAVAVLAMTVDSRPRWTGLAAAILVLLGTYLASNASVAFLTHDHMQFYPAMDAACAAFFLVQWRIGGHSWSLALAALFGYDCLLHYQYYVFSDRSFEARYDYDLSLNVVYLFQLGCVALPAIYAIIEEGASHRGQSRD